MKEGNNTTKSFSGQKIPARRNKHCDTKNIQLETIKVVKKYITELGSGWTFIAPLLSCFYGDQ